MTDRMPSTPRTTAPLFAAVSDARLDDCTLSGPVGRVREGVEAWFDAGVTDPVLVPSGTSGGQVEAFRDLVDDVA